MAALLRTNESLSVKSLLKAVLNSGLLGLGVSLLWIQVYEENPFFLVGICLLTGLGGAPTLDFVLEVARRLVVGFTMNQPKGTTKEKSDE